VKLQEPSFINAKVVAAASDTESTLFQKTSAYQIEQ
jgi:hypothetical protein